MHLYFNVSVCLIAVILTLSLKPSGSTSSSSSAHHPTGTVLFHNKKCWQHEDLALLSSRKIVQNLIPTNELDVDNDGYITNLIDYFRMCFSTSQKMSSGRAQDIFLLALADAIGGYLHYYVLPLTKEAFYCGNIRYDHATKLYNFYEEIKVHLDTSGKRWATPMDTSKREFKTRALTVPSPCEDLDPCADLLIDNKLHSRNSRESISAERPSLIPMPYLDDAETPTSIAVPFRASSLLPLTSPRAAFVLEKYYVTGVQCLMSRGGDDSREDLAAFDAHLYQWLEQTVVPRLKDDRWYPAFGGVRMILKTIKSNGHCDGSLDAEGPSTSDQNDGSVDSDVQDEMAAAEGYGSSISTWSSLVAFGFGTLTAGIVVGLACICYNRCASGKTKKSKGATRDDNYQLINTFVQIFYDKDDCGKKKERKDDDSRKSTEGSSLKRLKSALDHRKSTAGPVNSSQSTIDLDHEEDHQPQPSTSGTDRRKSTSSAHKWHLGGKHNSSHSGIDHEEHEEDHNQSTSGPDRHKATSGADRHQSVARKASWHSTMDHEEEGQPNSEADRRPSVTRKGSTHSSSDLEEHNEDQHSEHPHPAKKHEGRGSIFGRSRGDSTTLEQVQTKQDGSSKKKRLANKTSPSSPKKGSRGKMPFSADSSRNNSVDSVVSRMTTGSEEFSDTDYTSSEEGHFINNGSK